ncbi:PREDICTED: 7-deoxyloganetin glucosyltransferase-like isoform X2 [Prunus mume]|uniref:Glycosyltransferase n=1 Tax=Prunus mume TaxID=102107 RepID=A0ABM0PBH8_PRUMU|nr:PREDICTED: 7-deoxyloganetin glucosyltransferase-like isoform X1 [Prunus mume]XP_016650344.1 PREDICTED: 7-deoxyloganetin glucosyltransferase-like isoform X2 [Prunus mume]
MSSMMKPHAVCIPLPAQGHINPMIKLAKLLHFKGFYITFVHTEFNYNRLLESRGSDALNGAEDFQFETISDGLPPTNQRGILDLPELCRAMPVEGQRSFRDLIKKLNKASSWSDVPAVSCIVSDGVMGFTLRVAQEFGIPEMLLFTPSGCGMLGYLHYEDLVERGYFPLKDDSDLSTGFLDTVIDWIPAMEGIRLKDLPTFLRTTNRDDTMFNYNIQAIEIAMKAQGVILNTFDELEKEFLDVITTKFPQLYTIGPLSLLQHNMSTTHHLDSIDSNLWKEDKKCLDWLDKREPQSVVYVNYGSLVIMTKEQLAEFAWGLANSKYPFLWVIRPNLVDGGEEILSNEDFMEETKKRGLFLEWGPQEELLKHPSIGGFLTHCGWNSTLESICEGVPLICWPFFAEQQTNCFYLCNKWGFGMEIDTKVKREKVERLVRELMEGEKGKKMREKAMEWKKKAEAATRTGGSSYTNFDMLVKQLKQEPIGLENLS